jgi:hypothetical protein
VEVVTALTSGVVLRKGPALGTCARLSPLPLLEKGQRRHRSNGRSDGLKGAGLARHHFNFKGVETQNPIAPSRRLNVARDVRRSDMLAAIPFTDRRRWVSAETCAAKPMRPPVAHQMRGVGPIAWPGFRVVAQAP